MSQQTRTPSLPPARLRSLESVLDQLIPASEDGRLPSAGGLGLAAAVEAAARQSAELSATIEQGLDRLEALARERGEADFASACAADQAALLTELVPLVPGFVPSLLFHTYAHYYQHPAVLEALGLEPRPPHPKGYPLEPGDLGLLDPVRARGRLYRET